MKKHTTPQRRLTLVIATMTVLTWSLARDLHGWEPIQDVDPRPTVVVLHSEANIGGWDVLLGDVATVEGTQPELTGRLLGEKLSTAPAPQTTKTMSQDQIAQILIDRGYTGKGIRLNGARVVRITTLGKTISGADLQRDGEEFLQEWLARSSDDSNLSEEETIVEAVGNVTDLVVPAGRRGTEVVFRGHPRNPNDRQVSIHAHVVIDGRTTRKIPLRFELRRFRNALVPVDSIRRGETFRSDNLAIRRVEVTNVKDRLVKSPEEIVGAVATRTLAPLTPILTRDAALPALFKKGQLVSIVLRNGSLTITTKARARTDGRKGETIALDNLASGKVIYGTVMPSGVVEMSPLPRTAPAQNQETAR